MFQPRLALRKDGEPKVLTMLEKKILVPLPKDVKRKLEDRAVENGRAMSREAAEIIKEAVK